MDAPRLGRPLTGRENLHASSLNRYRERGRSRTRARTRPRRPLEAAHAAHRAVEAGPRTVRPPQGPALVLNVEMWERFSYYGMRAILLYFITGAVTDGGLGLSHNSGQVILALYGTAVYLLAIPGGIFADRIIGPWPSTHACTDARYGRL